MPFPSSRTRSPKVGPLQVLPLGIGGAFSKFDYYCSLLILGGGTRCLIDCPDPIHKVLHEQTSRAGLSVNAGDIEHLVLTHLHGDHSNGLESLLFYRKYVARVSPPTIYALAETLEALWPRKLAVSMERSCLPAAGIDDTHEPEDFYETRVVDEGRSFSVGDLTFEIRRTQHSVPTFGFRVSCGGRVFGYGCDTRFDAALIDFLSAADLVFHECGEEPLHTPYEKLMALDPGVRGKIHILHLADQFDRAGSELPIVEPGRLYAV
jgi:ribonuclease BN (tRNA processing enzyme)